MAQSIRITITPEVDKALQVLRKSTMGTLNTTELIKMAVGGFAKAKALEMTTEEMSIEEMDMIGARSFYEWAKEDGTLEEDNISDKAKLRPFIPESYVPDR